MTELLYLVFPELLSVEGKENKPTRGIPVDFYEEEGSYRLDAILPGYSKDSISLSTEKGTLTITAKSKEKKVKPIFSESPVKGDLERSFKLNDDIDSEAVSASYKNGVLSITLPKQESKKLKDIKIK